MKAAELFIKTLENEGVEYIFGLPGEENLDFLEALRKSDRIKLIITRHEQGAGFMAATYGRLTGKAGVCLSTLGPGATNMVTPTAYAQLGAMPMVIITGQKPIKSSKQGKFQILDVVEMMKPLTKFTKQITHSATIPAVTREAFRLAQDERPGAVHIELPEDIAAEEVTKSRTFDVVNYRIPTVDQNDLERAVELISEAKNPLLMVGSGANRKRASQALTEFVDTIDMPFVNTQMGKGIIDERHKNYVGTAALSDNDFVHEAFDGADLIINVGHDTIEKPPFFMSEENDCKVIHINFFPAEIDSVYFPHLNLIGDIAATINKLKNALTPHIGGWDFSFFNAVKNNVEVHIDKYANDDRFPILPQRLVAILRQQLQAKDIITLDNGIYKLWFARNYPVYSQNTLILDNALATMGAGLASAIMTKELNPSHKVVSVNGDGGFMMNSQELETAARMGLDLVVIILNDNAYGMIQWKQKDMGLADYGLDYKNPDFMKYAESFGATGYKPTSVTEFNANLQTALNGKGIHLIDLAVDYSLNHQILNVLLPAHPNKLLNHNNNE